MIWHFTTRQPPSDWFKPGFEASNWTDAPAGFGTRDTPGAVVRTTWNTPDIWLLREFSLPDRKLKAPALRIHHDEDVEVYINGIPAAKAKGYTTEYKQIDLQPKAGEFLRPGINRIAVHCHQTIGAQYIDVGITESP